MKILALALLVVFGGCAVHKHDGRVHWHSLVEVVIPEGHLHDLFCGHCFYKGKWYFQKDHVHGPDCGHVFREGFWTFERDPEEERP